MYTPPCTTDETLTEFSPYAPLLDGRCLHLRIESRAMEMDHENDHEIGLYHTQLLKMPIKCDAQSTPPCFIGHQPDVGFGVVLVNHLFFMDNYFGKARILEEIQ